MARDAAWFLMRIAGSGLETRREAGLKVTLFRVVLVGVINAYKRQA